MTIENAHDLAREMLEAKTEVDAAIEDYRKAVREDAEADDRCRRAMARAFVECREDAPKGTVPYISALVDERTSDLQKAARLAEGYKRAAGMRVDGARQWMSSLQSVAATLRAEMEMNRWEPREVSA